MAEQYLIELDNYGYARLWEFSDSDKETADAEEEKEVKKSFVSFLRYWRERILQTLESQKPGKDEA
jgi:hypothetical protein